jgi:hypothetical protein
MNFATAKMSDAQSVLAEVAARVRIIKNRYPTLGLDCAIKSIFLDQS